LSCLDPRFTEYIAWFLSHNKQVHASYDLVTLAGGSLGVTQGNSTAPAGAQVPWPVHASWSSTFFDHVRLAISLHGVQEVWAFDHLDCGAYKAFALAAGVKDSVVGPHETQQLALQAQLLAYTDADPVMQAAVRGLSFKAFVVATDGTVTEVIDDGRGCHLHASDEVVVDEVAAAACAGGGDTTGAWAGFLVIALVLVIAAALAKRWFA